MREAPSLPLLGSTVIIDLAIYNNRHEPVALCVLELHDLMTAASQLSPSARLLRVLLDRLVMVALNTECGGFQMLSIALNGIFTLPLSTSHADSRTSPASIASQLALQPSPTVAVELGGDTTW